MTPDRSSWRGGAGGRWGADRLAGSNDRLVVGCVVEAEALAHVLSHVGTQERDLGDLRVQGRLLLLAGQVGVHVEAGGEVPFDQVARRAAGARTDRFDGRADEANEGRGRPFYAEVGDAGFETRRVDVFGDEEDPAQVHTDLDVEQTTAGLLRRRAQPLDDRLHCGSIVGAGCVLGQVQRHVVPLYL